MNPYFSSTSRIALVQATAALWLGTPFCANSQARGPRGGVACHNLPRAILMECQALPTDFPTIEGDPADKRYSRVSRMEPFLDGRPEFVRVSDHLAPGALLPGDVVGLQIGNCINHLGVYVGSGRFIHVMMTIMTRYDSLNDPSWSSRTMAAWRPLDLETSHWAARTLL